MGRRKYYYKKRRRKSLIDKMVDDALSPSFGSGRRRRKKVEPEIALAAIIMAIVVFAVLSSDSFDALLEFFVLLVILVVTAAILAVVYIVGTLISKKLKYGAEKPEETIIQITPPPLSDDDNKNNPTLNLQVAEHYGSEDVEREIEPSREYQGARVKNQIGSLTELQRILRLNGVDGFDTLDEIRKFRNEYKGSVEEIKEKNRELLSKVISNFEKGYEEAKKELDEKISAREQELRLELAEYENAMTSLENPSSIVEQVTFFIKRNKIAKRKPILDTSFDDEVRRPFRKLIQKVEFLESEIKDRKNNPQKWVDSFSAKEIQKQEQILSVFVENKSLFYGAEGEERVSNELSKLPSKFTVINDFRVYFERPIYNQRENDRIYSIQIDHIVVGPTGIFLIETKNWSKASVESRDMRSPVKQLKRHSFAMFVVLNQAVDDGKMEPFVKNWGGVKISPHNLVVLMNHKPKEEFQFVKVMTVDEIKGYILGERVVFNNDEVEALVDYLDYIS